MKQTTPPTGLEAGVPLELGEPRASGEGEALGAGSWADSANLVGRGMKGHNQPQG